MLMFTLAISCLNTSNLPWFMDLTFQVPRQYCSLQHQTLLPSPAPFTTWCCFCFGSIPSFFLGLFLHWSPVAYWAPTDLGSFSESGEWKSWLKAQHSENEDHGIRSHHLMGNRWGNSGNSVRLYFWGAPKSLQMVTAVMKLKDAYSLEGKLCPT